MDEKQVKLESKYNSLNGSKSPHRGALTFCSLPVLAEVSYCFVVSGSLERGRFLYCEDHGCCLY